MKPDWWEFLLMALAAYRTFRLIAWDTIADRPRAWVLGRVKKRGRDANYWYLFVTCPFCAGFWISLAWVCAFWLAPYWTTVVAVPWAVSAFVALVATNVDPESREED